MRRYTYLLIVGILLCQLSLPVTVSDGLRSAAVATLAPSWNLLSYLKVGAIWPWGSRETPAHVQEEMSFLRMENHHLHQQIELLKAQMELEKLIGEEAEFLKRFEKGEGLAQRRKLEIERLLELYMPAVIGQVIFREPSSWTSSLWINLGKKSNLAFGKEVIAKNSPVVLGTSLVGIVEYVGESRSRIRLITDASIVPAVRAIREGDLYLAKGEICGVATSGFRSRAGVLRGVGFNYDFEDEEGPSRDLLSSASSISLVQKGDLLVTTGMDGVFPSGLRVGQVCRVYPLCEGASSYEVDATALAGDFNTLTFVMVLPPLSSEEDFLIDKD